MGGTDVAVGGTGVAVGGTATTAATVDSWEVDTSEPQAIIQTDETNKLTRKIYRLFSIMSLAISPH